MSAEAVKTFFSQYGLADKIQEFSISSATVALAAQALHCAPERIAKTLSFKQKKAQKTILIVAAGDAKIDNAKYKAAFSERALMLKPEEVEPIVGHPVGGVCPFAVNAGVEIYLDESLKRFESVYPACGNSNNAIELTITELEKYTSFKQWIDVCKNWA
ncbi:YbaK/EbsC family protein [Enterococcus dongliensis]|uniref:YbaK/EbsC family protein n=1 Tax=Enterococcus dongliensis TaxID=2559925 RepID=A0AAP5KN32_9ENTE|nr:YbaK/EbsC family protein [Enterococcus dongliensis]MDT2595442.1 YbaK/EbsC family protein [Enterococcus dongliensis]MDT2603344.1 YbaK/EbsC family protein [Enterococcus dongliensis]MDT2633705.1 YbaK/EbsC family protein [Enterococcus dongliensis]MDT2635921.1 YbaK/EbsC family protein [Enterococcus dongliensis]MDT2639805.1 YbaK/EbsC family protein [Enterococcus dongliensis]